MRALRKLRSRAKPSIARLISSVFPRYFLLLKSGDRLLLKKGGRLILKAPHVSYYDPYVALAGKIALAVDWRRTDLVTASGSPPLASSILDVIAAADFAQASGSLRPGYDPPGGFDFDGIDDYVSLEATPMPTGGNPFYFAGLVRQTALDADGTVRNVASWGGTSNGTNVRLQRVVSGGVNRLRVNIGGSAGIVILTDTSTVFYGDHVIECWSDGTTAYLAIDDNTPVSAACVPTISTTRTRIGAVAGAVSTTLWQGEVFLAHWLNALPTTDERTDYIAELLALKAAL